MKNLLKVLCLVWGIFWLGILSFIVRWEDAPFQISWNSSELAHRVRLTNLWIWDTMSAWLKAWENNLDVLNGVVAGSGNTIDGNIVLSSVGGWENNKIKWSYAGVVWWFSNTAWNSNSAVGGWDGNTADWSNAVIAWWKGNSAGSDWWVILWWEGNTTDGEYGIVLWWSENTAWAYGLSLWHGSAWADNTFSWRDSELWEWNGPLEDSAHIGATSWVLIWTYNPIPWVNLVVNGAVKIEWGAWDLYWPEPWEIRMIDWCVFAYDGNKWHILGKNSNDSSSCKGIIGDELAVTCNYGETMIWEWDEVIWYNSPYGNCGDNKCTKLVCEDWWKLVCRDGDKNGSLDYIYPYCYSLGVE